MFNFTKCHPSAGGTDRDTEVAPESKFATLEPYWNIFVGVVGISVRGGGRGAVAPQIWKNFQKSAPLGQNFALKC